MTTPVTNVQKTVLMRLNTWERLTELRQQTDRRIPSLLDEAIYDLSLKLLFQEE